MHKYKPLLVILAFCVLIPLVTVGTASRKMMYAFMGYFFLFLSMFKFFDLNGFVNGFSTYDLITKKVRAYGYVYPFIECALGFAYLAEWQLQCVNWVTFVIMMISGVGVLKSVFSGHKLKCACLGTVLNVPLSTVSVIENFGMGAMAAYSLMW